MVRLALAPYTFPEMPRIEYTLSFENYLEMTSSQREKKDLRIAGISAIAGFCFIVAGYLSLKASMKGSFFPGGLFLATGLLLTCLGMVLGLLAKRKSSRPDAIVLRQEYDLFHADSRAIEFDESGWRLSWYEGEDVRPWSCLRQVHDLETLLVLGTTTTHYWLPKETLRRQGQLDHLKALAESFLTKRQLLFEVPMRPSPLVYFVAGMFHSWRRQLRSRILSYAALTLIAYWIFFSSAAAVQPTHLWRLALVPVFLILCEGLFYLTNYYKADWSKAPQNAEITSDCIGYKTKTIHWIAEYRRLKEMQEIPGAFLLYFDANSYHLIPKRGFSLTQIAQFRELVSNNR
jgi:YcxB-like protein